MTITIAEAMEGADFEGGEQFGDCHYNNLKNHWRANYGGEPCGSAGLEQAQPGMIISDSYDDRLYHVILASGCPCSEIIQTCIPVPDDVPIYFGYEFDGAIYYDELSTHEFFIEVRAHADVEGVTINLLEENQRFRIRQNADYITMYLDGLHAFLSWSDGHLNLHTDEDGANTQLHIHGNGAGYGQLFIYDEDDAEFLEIDATGGVGIIRTGGSSPAQLALQDNVAQNITCWEAIVAGNPDLRLYGWISAGGARRYGQFRMDDTYDEFFIEAEANANHEGITVSLLEAAQRFRVRGIAGAERFWIDEAGILGYTRVGELRQWTYQGDLADDASFTLPAFTDACWGFIQAGANEEYALFSVDDDGDVTLLSNSANVVANADTDDKLCLGIASPEEPLTIRNRLDATKNINLIIWYS